MRTLISSLLVGGLSLGVLMIAGCGASGDAFTPVNDQFPTSLDIKANTVVLGGPLKAGTVTADAVTVEPFAATVGTPDRATVTTDAWSYTMGKDDVVLSSQKVRVRWFKDGSQIAQRAVDVKVQ